MNECVNQISFHPILRFMVHIQKGFHGHCLTKCSHGHDTHVSFCLLIIASNVQCTSNCQTD